MQYEIYSASRLPIYQQLVQQVREAIARGDLQPEAQLPSVRQLSRDLVINPNTVARAYRQLQDDGVLQSVRGTGLAVADGAGRRCQTERVNLLRHRIQQVLVEAKQSQLEHAQLRSLVESELAAIDRKEV